MTKRFSEKEVDAFLKAVSLAKKANIDLGGPSKERLTFPAQLLNLENLEYLELQGNFEITEVDFSKLKKLKTLVLSGTKSPSSAMMEKLMQQEVKVVIN